MKKQGKVMALIEKGVNFADKHQREIMLGGAIAGTVVTAVLSFKAGLKADSILKEQRDKMDLIIEAEEDEDGEKNVLLTPEEVKERKREITVETVKKLAPIMIPVVISGAGTIVSVIAGYKAASTQIATLSALYNISEKALSDYTEKAKELVGKKKVSDIEEAVAKKRIDETPITDSSTIINTGRGDVRFLDPVSGRYFYSKPEAVKAAVNAVNNKTNVDGYFVPLNEFYNELGIPPIDLGREVGFKAGELIDIDYIFRVTLDSCDNPVYVLNYNVEPGHGYFYE